MPLPGSCVARQLLRRRPLGSVAGHRPRLRRYQVSARDAQSYRNFGWGHKFQLWCNANDRSPAAGFSDSGRALANVLWIHYVSKVIVHLSRQHSCC